MPQLESMDLFHRLHGQVHTGTVIGPHDANDISYVDLILSGVSDEQMRVRPAAGVNTLAWLVWHTARAEDIAVNAMVAGGPQVLDAIWLGRLGVSSRDMGTGMTPAEVAHFSDRVNLEQLRAYRDAVAHRTQEVVRSIAPEGWADGVDENLKRAVADGVFGASVAPFMEAFWSGKPRKWFLWQPTGHAFYHVGEMACIRGLLGLPGFG